VHLRRALLLFAIVLGLAAVAASLSRSREEPREQPAPSPPASSAERTEPNVSPGQIIPAQPPARLRFVAERDQTRQLEFGQPGTLEVAVEDSGQVEIPLLGLTTTADSLTPARFEVLPPEARRYPITFTPAAGDETREAGTLLVTSPEK
jgi:hypothetical protein